MDQLPSPHMNQASIQAEYVLEDVMDASSAVRTNVLCSASGAYYAIGDVVKKTIYGAVAHGIQLEEVYTHNSSAKVFKCTEQEVAIKVFSKQLIVQHMSKSREQPLNEVALLQYLGNNHRNVLGQIECCADDKQMYSVMQWVSGGELFDHIADHGRMSETQARSLFRNLVEGVMHLHQTKFIAHRDISLENVLYEPSTNTAMIIDFGMALPMFHRRGRSSPFSYAADSVNGRCGKANYMAPEVLRGDSRVDAFASDVWALGVCLLYVLLGFPPMEHAAYDDQRFSLIVDGQLRELLAHWGVNLSEDALDLVESILQESADKRPSLQQILRHPWMQMDSHKASLQNTHVLRSSNSHKHTQQQFLESDSHKRELRDLSRRETSAFTNMPASG